ncbi:hypothetical protein LSTR_LSTR016589 [Laodelphax striatellus]|uniref:Uncharacterized protein n=1 Tax=Laodelphax striatellus TaxID=195883 RepID=A0A482WZG0_LAOST|nr:hypothetical protein LSTR_LSTR016589 [Laodelphax striatellus]
MDGSLSSSEQGGVAMATKNISYKRSYLPLQYWNATAILDRPGTALLVRRQSLRDCAQLALKFRQVARGVYWVNSTMVKVYTIW